MAQGKKFYSRPTMAAVITVLVLAAICVPTTIAFTKAEPEKKNITIENVDEEIATGDFESRVVPNIGDDKEPNLAEEEFNKQADFLENNNVEVDGYKSLEAETSEDTISTTYFTDVEKDAEKVDLKLRLKAGDSHEMKLAQTQNITQSFNGQEVKMTQVMEMLFGLDCKNVDKNGIMSIEITYKAVKMTADGMGQKVEFDSANPKPVDANNPREKMMTAIFSAMVGCKFGMQISPTGETIGISGLEEMRGKMKEKLGDLNKTKMVDTFLSKIFNEKELKSMAGSLMVISPKASAAVGDTWYDTMTMNPIEIDLAKMPMQLAGTMNYSANQVDEETGLVKKSIMTLNFSGVAKTEGQGDPNTPTAQNLNIPTTIVSTTIVELIK